jgi:ribonucleotide monophosphatase NagD (HAD superfamily)
MGIAATPGDVITSANATARYLASRRDLDGRGALVCGPPALRDEITRSKQRCPGR